MSSQQAKAWASVLVTVIASAMMRVVATASPLPRIAMGMPTGVEDVPRITVVPEMLMH